MQQEKKIRQEQEREGKQAGFATSKPKTSARLMASGQHSEEEFRDLFQLLRHPMPCECKVKFPKAGETHLRGGGVGHWMALADIRGHAFCLLT